MMQRNVIAAAVVGVGGMAGIAAALVASSSGTSPGSAGITVVPSPRRGAPPSPANAKPAAAAVTASGFVASSADIPNPERGFYRAAAASNLDSFTQDDANAAYNENLRLVYARINLEGYRSTDTLPAAYLTKLRTAFGYARNAGIKLIVRAVYNFPDGETNYQTAKDAPLARVQKHLSQLKPVLQDNADVIAFVQAGFIGAWGEWHTSSNKLADTESNRTAVKDALLDAVPASRSVQFRYPWHIEEWASSLPTVDAAVANKFRLGFHNDCFLSSVEDVGTYSEDATERKAERDYADRLGNVGPVGGETCNSTDDSSAVRRTTCNDILTEGARYNFSYLNTEYWRDQFHERWISGGCMPTVRTRMGYRFVLTQASHDNSVARGGTLTVTFGINNAGWARLYNPRLVQVVLQNVGTSAVQRITTTGADPRKWVPGTNSASVSAVVPSGLAAGTYRVLLALPDAASTLTANPRYAIRFANNDNSGASQYWDTALAAFSIGTTVQVS